ncbi:MAG: hypothetical protein K2X79_08290 [Burkholderiaceae bacterium]|nr:hypothetical protein [Burkholderiaceae bacterium]
MTEPWLWIAGLLTPVVVVVLGLYGYVEYQARLLKTRSGPIPGGLRFEANGWSVEVQRAAQQLLVLARQGHYARESLEGGAMPEPGPAGPVSATLPAVGLQIEVTRTLRGEPGQTPQPTGLCSVVFRASDESAFAAAEKPGGERHLLRLEGVPEPVAANFHQFAGQIRVWVDRLDRNLAQEVLQRKQRLEAEAEAEARAAARAKKAAEQPVMQDLEPEAQIAHWRKVAGFSGTSEVGYADDGKIDWFIDLDPRGRITLHADRRTIHTTLLGATVSSLAGELEVAVRDDYWSEAEPELKSFRLFKGAHSDVRRAWKERLEILCSKLRSGEIS